MPKQIKKREITKGEKLECVIAIIAMAVGICFTAAFIIMIPDIDNNSRDVQLIKSVIAASSYVLFVLLAVAEAVIGIKVYLGSRVTGTAMRGFFAAVSAFIALLSLRFMLAMFFSGLGEDSIVDKIIGDSSYATFIKNQAPGFACLVIALTIMIFVGLSAIVKLAKR